MVNKEVIENLRYFSSVFFLLHQLYFLLLLPSISPVSLFAFFFPLLFILSLPVVFVHLSLIPLSSSLLISLSCFIQVDRGVPFPAPAAGGSGHLGMGQCDFAVGFTLPPLARL